LREQLGLETRAHVVERQGAERAGALAAGQRDHEVVEGADPFEQGARCGGIATIDQLGVGRSQPRTGGLEPGGIPPGDRDLRPEGDELSSGRLADARATARDDDLHGGLVRFHGALLVSEICSSLN
jgi:hypothetical protein